MWNQLARATAVAVLFVVAADAPVFSQQQTLNWKFTPGQRLDYVVQQDMKMSMDYNGREIASTMKQTINTSWVIQRVTPQGNAEMVQKINRIRIVMEGGPLGKVEFDTAAKTPPREELSPMATVFGELIKARIQTTMSPTGKILATRVPPELLETLKNSPGVGAAGFSEESLQQMFNQSGVIMPQTPVSIGSKWTSANEVKTPAGRMVFNSTLDFRGMQDYQGRKFARIDMKPTVRMVPDPNSDTQVRVKSADGKGAVLFDHTNGRIERTKLSSKMVMTVTQDGQSIDQTIDQTVSMALVPKQVAANPANARRGE
jgi:hypothetical protein